MSEQAPQQTFDEVDNLSFFEPEDLVTAMKPKVAVIVYEGRQYRIKSPNGFEWFNLISRFPAVQALTANVADKMIRAVLASPSDLNNEQFEELMADIIAEHKFENLFDIFMKVGADAAAAFIAICLGRPGNKDFEASLSGADNEGLIILFKACANYAFGGRNPADFFTERLTDFVKLGGIDKAKRAAQKRKQRVTSTKQPNAIATKVSK